MRIAIIAVVLAATSLAIAQPVDDREACAVTIVRAPEQVATEIEAWVRTEPRCTSSIELRVIPTEDGLYLLAQRADGRIHERVVPDAQSAAVLVTSWIAEDWVDPAPPARAAQPTVTPLAVRSPGEAPAKMHPHAPSSGWLSLGMMMRPQEGGGYGARGEVDLLAHGAWTLGAALSVSTAALTARSAEGPGHMHTRDLRALAYLARTSSFGGWQLRAGIGLGYVHTDAELVFEDASLPSGMMASGTLPVIDASALLSRTIGANWAIAAGPVVTYISQTLDGSDRPFVRNDLELMVVGGVRHRR